MINIFPYIFPDPSETNLNVLKIPLMQTWASIPMSRHTFPNERRRKYN